MNIPYYFTNKVLAAGLNINLDSRQVLQKNSKRAVPTKFLETEEIQVNIIMKQFADIYERILNQQKFEKQTVFPARFDKQDEDNQALDEIELNFILNINQKFTEYDNKILYIRSEHEKLA